MSQNALYIETGWKANFSLENNLEFIFMIFLIQNFCKETKRGELEMRKMSL
jgi:hypothetical protein